MEILFHSTPNKHSFIVVEVFHLLKHQTPGNGSIYVRDDYLVVPVPEVDGSLTATGSLVLSGHTKHNIIRTILQLKGQLRV